MNVIDYSPYTFDDSAIISGSVDMQNSLMFDALNPDQLSVEVVCHETGDAKLLTNELEWYHTVNNEGYIVAQGDIRNYTYGDPVMYYYNGILQGKFYIRSIERLSVDHFRLDAISLVGLLASVQHLGGIYDGTTAGDIIDDLLDGYTYIVAPDVRVVELYGWLPVASIRDNLQQVLFAVGASLFKDNQGNPVIKFIDTNTVVPVSDDRIYIGGTLSYRTPATSVSVTEHAFYESTYDVEVSLYDNTDGTGYADNKLVLFDAPCHSLVAVGLTINSSGANYAYVTGTGTLTGKKYTHTTRQIVSNTGRNGATKESNVERATLVSVANSANVAARVADYEATAQEVACGIVLTDDNIKPGTLISFNDPYGDASQGFISKMNVRMSGSSKGECTVITDYVPSNFGNNYENVAVITSDGSWSVPVGVDRIRLVLIGGGRAGQNGWFGEDAIRNSRSQGQGGAGGGGGDGGKVFVYEILNPSGTFAITLGTGGTPGNAQGNMGNLGTDTTAVNGEDTYTSADGAIMLNGFKDVLNNVTYAQKGVEGVAGAPGGFGGAAADAKPGGDLTYNGVTYTGGAGATSIDNKWGYAGGGGGGGAAYGANGHDGERGDSQPFNEGGNGGAGADPLQLPIVANYGEGGAGGCGGGGGGGAGAYKETGKVPTETGFGSPGAGGYYSKGCNGGDGIALIYY